MQAGQQALFKGTWGVFAAEGPGHVLEVRGTGQSALAGAAVPLSGSKPWCSLAGYLDRAIVTAKTQAGSRQAFAVDLRSPGVEVEEPRWISHGLREIPSGTVHFTDVPAVPVGEPGWYFERPGFAWEASVSRLAGWAAPSACSARSRKPWRGGNLTRSRFPALANRTDCSLPDLSCSAARRPGSTAAHWAITKTARARGRTLCE
ncbi:acyl-CoA dehydrogenase family protein [Arthrobacter sp. NA-172]|uniref:acyl-CoA dehydrogenase family protein n=1 Tax=Arthrobacter sp. NA-172 TaxID=3367524 RepID=UPI003754FED5